MSCTSKRRRKVEGARFKVHDKIKALGSRCKVNKKTTENSITKAPFDSGSPIRAQGGRKEENTKE
jgi:hypothetical protein